MSIRTRIEDGFILWHTNRREGALLSSLVAAAATSRKRYPQGNQQHTSLPKEPNVRLIDGKGRYWPTLDKNNRLAKPKGDRVAFSQFIHDEMRTITAISRNFLVKSRGEMWPLEEFLYKFVRCELAHEAKLPEDIIFEPGDQLSVGVTDEAITFSEVLVDRIMMVVRLAPENAEGFKDWDEWTKECR